MGAMVPLEWAILGNRYYYILHFPKHTSTPSDMATHNLDSPSTSLHIKRLLLLLALSLCHLLLFSSPPPLPQKKLIGFLKFPIPCFSCVISSVPMDSCTSKDIPTHVFRLGVLAEVENGDK